MSTLHNLLDRIYEDEDDPDRDLTAGIAVMQILRSIHQREPATLEGCCASLKEFIDQRGCINRTTLTKFLTDCDMLDVEIPTHLLKMAISGD